VTVDFVSGTGGPLVLQVSLSPSGPFVDLDSIPFITITNLNVGAVVVGPTQAGVTHPSTGTYVYTWSAPVSGGTYMAVWDGVLDGDDVSSSEVINVYSPSTVTPGPCDWTIDTGCCSTWDSYSAAVQQHATEYATTVLWAATGRRFGLCTQIVRPCGRYCSELGSGGLGTYGYFWSEGTWLPYIFNGEWRNCWCGCNGSPGCCGCNVDCQVYLEGPVNNIISVTVDGETIDPNTYRVDNGVWLVRTHDESTSDCWPMFQNFNKSSGEGTFIVTYQKGLAVPGPLQRAAGELACEFAKACTGADCRLPSRASSISRQGVSISQVSVDLLLEKGLTGITTVDQIIRTYNPYGLTSPMRVVSPDFPERTRVTTWP
jgi:hypothetical protein